jgi:acyl carrier protein
LQLSDIGVHQDFFAHLGGDSLLATKVGARLRDYLQIEVPLRSLFETPTVESLAASLSRDGQGGERIERAAAVALEVLMMSDEAVEAHLADGTDTRYREGTT